MKKWFSQCLVDNQKDFYSNWKKFEKLIPAEIVKFGAELFTYQFAVEETSISYDIFKRLGIRSPDSFNRLRSQLDFEGIDKEQKEDEPWCSFPKGEGDAELRYKIFRELVKLNLISIGKVKGRKSKFNLSRRFRVYRKKEALRIQKQFGWTTDEVKLLPFKVFNCILNILQNKTRLTEFEFRAVQLLEGIIQNEIPAWFSDLGLKDDIVKLSTLRQNTKAKVNTCCYKCFKTIRLETEKHYCTQKINRLCQRKKANRNDIANKAWILNKGLCKCGCGMPASRLCMHKSGCNIYFFVNNV